MSSVINFGIWGIGRMGIEHAKYFSLLKEMYKPVAFYDFAMERAREASEQFGGKYFEDVESFLANPEMDLVIIATRSLDHVPNATLALEAGKRVLLEKPIGVTDSDYKKLQELVKKYPGKLFFGQNHRFEPAHSIAYDIVKSGILGKIHTVKITKFHRFGVRCDWQMLLAHGGGQLSVWGPHVIDQTLHFLNSPVKTVWSRMERILTPGDADDHFKIIIGAESGAYGEIEVSNAAALSQPYCMIFGDRGALSYNGDQKEISLRYIDPDFKMPELQAFAETPANNYVWGSSVQLPWVIETRQVDLSAGMTSIVENAMAKYLYDALNGTADFPVTSEQALEVVRLTGVVKSQNPQFNWLQ